MLSEWKPGESSCFLEEQSKGRRLPGRKLLRASTLGKGGRGSAENPPKWGMFRNTGQYQQVTVVAFHAPLLGAVQSGGQRDCDFDLTVVFFLWGEFTVEPSDEHCQGHAQGQGYKRVDYDDSQRPQARIDL